MNEIRINAKSTPDYVEFLPKVKAGFHHIEIQLIHSFLKESEYLDTKKAIEELNVDISVVHTPLVKNEFGTETDDISLIHLLRADVYEMFEDTCKYVQYVAELQGRRIKVVVHNNNSIRDIKETNFIKEKVAPKLRKTLSKYDKIDLVIENSCATDIVGFKTVFDMDDVAFAVKEINEALGEKRAYPLVDTCHIMMSFEAWKRISGQDLLNFDETFRKASEYGKLGLIHLNNLWDNGFDKDHGRPFDLNHSGDLEKLSTIMKAYEKYADCEITIEVAEDDYLAEPKNIIATRASLEKLGYKLDC